MPEKIIIASDSTCDLSSELIERYGVKILPLKVSVGGNNYTDGVDVDPDMIYDIYEKTGELPKTAAINIAEFEEFFADCASKGYSVIFFTISSEMSSTFKHAQLAAEEYDNIYVVDTRNLSTGGGLLVVTAAEMIKEGKSASEIAAKCEELAHCVDASFVIDSLEFLYKGGRCSAVAAAGAAVLGLKPCISVKEGKMGVGKKYRGKFEKVLPQYVGDRVGNGDGICKKHIFVTHAGCEPGIYEACAEQLRALGCFDEIHITRAGCTISSHCGRNTLGVLFIREEPI